eukprot:Nk52_evm1s2653 gene=Nk52_evmTU1s2653
MEQAGVVRRSTSPWASPVFCVPKPPNLLRMVCDYAYVDSQMEHTINVLPNPEVDIFAGLLGCKYFTAIDLTTAYYSMKVSEGSKQYTAVILRDGRQFEFNTLSMGFSNAPHVFNTALSHEFNDMPFVHVFLDDIIIASRTEAEHSEHILR